METTVTSLLDSVDVDVGQLVAARFGIADYVVFICILAVSAGIGVFYACSGGKQQSTNEFLMGNRSMSVFPVAMSILASFISAITLLGTPAEMYNYGTQYVVIILSFFLVIPAAAYLYLPIFFELQLTSAYEYLELRFNRKIRSLASIVFSLQMMIYMAIVLYAPALALSQVTGIGVWFSVLSLGIVCTFYTSIGGIKAVIWTDLFQITMMFVSMFIVVIKGSSDVGGMKEVWNINYQNNRIELFNFDPDPTTRHTVWNLIIGGYFTWVAIYGVNQTMVQRYLTLPSVKKARTAIWINLPGLIAIILLTSIAGMIIYAKFHSCDPILTRQVKASDQLFPLFVMETLGEFPGLPGLFVSGIFSGALSTVSSGVNSMAAVTFEDGVKTLYTKQISDLWATRVTKLLAVFYGIIAIILVLVAQQMGNVLQAALSIFGMIGGPLLGLFTFGMFCPWGNSLGAGVGLLGGLTFSLWLGFGAFANKPYNPKAEFSVDGCLSYYQNVTGQSYYNSTIIPPEQDILPFYRMSYMWYSAFGCVATIFIGLILSFATGRAKAGDYEPKLISPVVRKICKSIPAFLSRNLEVQHLIMDDPKVTEAKKGVLNLSYVDGDHVGPDAKKVTTNPVPEGGPPTNQNGVTNGNANSRL